MNSIRIHSTQPTSIQELAPWSRGQIGIRLRAGGLRFLPWAGFIQRDWLPSWATPVALAVTSWGVGPGRGQTGNHHAIESGFIVGAVMYGRAWAVLYDGQLREV